MLEYQLASSIEKVQPILRWAGSKRQLLPQLNNYTNKLKYNKYLEPFIGAGHLFFDVSPEISIISDINYDLIVLYNIIKKDPEKLHELIKDIPVEKDTYYNIRSLNPNNLTDFERAARFIYLNRYCFNGLYRTDGKGNFNVPFSPNRTGRLPSLEQLKLISKRLKRAIIIPGDFEDVLKANLEENDFVYLDPPYLISKRSFKEYSQFGFSNVDFNRLLKCLDYIDSKNAYFVLSYAYSEFNYSFFQNWNIEVVETNRKIQDQ